MPYAWHAHPDVWLLIAVLLGGYFWALRHIGPRHTAPGQPNATAIQKLCWMTGVVTFAIVAAFVLAHAIGQRHPGQTITGNNQVASGPTASGGDPGPASWR